jgi:hypothetical protein
MNKLEQTIQRSIDEFKRKFGVFERTIYYENINDQLEICTLRTSIDQTSPNGFKTLVNSFDLFTMIFGKDRTDRFYLTPMNPFRSFVDLDVCKRGELFSESFLEGIPDGIALYEHFLMMAGDGILKFRSSIIHITTSYMDDFFSNPNPDIEYLQKIISNKDPSCYGLWERIVLEKYKMYMPRIVTRGIYHSTFQGTVPLLTLKVIFATMISEEPAARRIVQQQLLDRKEKETYDYFMIHFLPFIKTCIDILVNYPYYHDDIYLAYSYVIGRIQFAWNSKSIHVCKITVDDRRKTLEDLATNARIKKATKKSKSQTKRGKRTNQKKIRIGRRGRQ